MADDDGDNTPPDAKLPPFSPERGSGENPLDTHPYAIGNIDPADRYGLALIHFRETIASSLFEEWPPTDDAPRWYCLAVLRELLPEDTNSYRNIVERLTNSPQLAREAGFDPDDIPHYATISRHLKRLDADGDTVTEAAARAQRAANHVLYHGGHLSRLGPDPPSVDPPHQNWTAGEPIEMGEKMHQATEVVGEYLALTMPALGFERDVNAPNYEYPPESFYRLLAHIALEDCYAANGAEILAWRTDDDVAVPLPSTLRQYARENEVEALEEKFIRATCRLLERMELLPEEPAHLAYDVTDVRWYGQDHAWTSSGQPTANTSDYWKFAVLSVAARERNYVLGATPIKDESEAADALRRLIRRVSTHANFNLGHVYCDRGMYREDVVTTCREQGLGFLVQAKDTGAPGELMARLDAGEADGENNVRFADLPRPKRVNTFAYPIHPGEIGSEERTGGHTAWITDYDVEDVPEEELRKYAYQFRDRWRVETAIRQLKHDFQGRCGSEKRSVRTFYFGAAQMFFNYWVALNYELAYHFDGRENYRVTATETLHAIRDADVESARGTSLRTI